MNEIYMNSVLMITNFFLYELKIAKNTNLSLMDIMILDAIKSIFISYTCVHLIIFISDEEFINNNIKNDNSFIDNLSI